MPATSGLWFSQEMSPPVCGGDISGDNPRPAELMAPRGRGGRRLAAPPVLRYRYLM